MKYKYRINVLVDDPKVPIDVPATIKHKSFLKALLEVWKLKRANVYKFTLICYK